MIYSNQVVRSRGSATALHWENFATDLTIDDDINGAMRGGRSGLKPSLFQVLQHWSMTLAFPLGAYRAPWAINSVDQSKDTKSLLETSVIALTSLLRVSSNDLRQNKVALIAAAEEGLTPILVILELLDVTNERPEIYTLKTGETALEYQFDQSRISCLVSGKYAHVMAYIGGGIEDKYFEGDSFVISEIRECFLNFLNKIEAHSSKDVASRKE